MEILAIILELLVVFLLTVFAGVLDSKYYSRKRIKHLQSLCWCAVVVLLAIVYVDSSPEETILHHTRLHLVYHGLIIATYLYALVRFLRIRFRYLTQYLVARAALFFGIILEIAGVICCYLAFS